MSEAIIERDRVVLPERKFPSTNWDETFLGNIIELKRGYDLPNAERKTGRIPIISSSGPSGYHNEAKAKKPGVVTGRYGTVGKLFYVDEDYWPLNTSLYVRDFKGNNPKFIYYFLQELDWEQFNDKSGVPGINRNDVHKKPVRVPPLSEQNAIATVLGALDDKIELNRKTNAMLEAMARALFKSWFVDFDPVRAKMEGLQPFGMDATTADLFPSRLVPSELGDIPEGWRVSNLGCEFEVIMGQSPPGETYNEIGDGLPFYQGRTDFGFRYPTRRIFCTQPNRVAEAGDTLISVRAPVGDINMAFEKCVLGRGVGSLRHKSKARGYTYYAVNSIQPALKAFEADGTVFGSVNKQDVAKITIIKPEDRVIEGFERIAHDIDEKILSQIKETAELEKNRDYLLPKLISGEIRIRDAEKLVGAT